MGNPRKAVFPNPEVTRKAVLESAGIRFFASCKLTNNQAPTQTTIGPINGRSNCVLHCISGTYRSERAGKAMFITQAFTLLYASSGNMRCREIMTPAKIQIKIRAKLVIPDSELDCKSYGLSNRHLPRLLRQLLFSLLLSDIHT